MYCCHKYNSDSLCTTHSAVEDRRSLGKNEVEKNREGKGPGGCKSCQRAEHAKQSSDLIQA